MAVVFLLMAAVLFSSQSDTYFIVYGDEDLPFRLCQQFKRPGETEHFDFCMECLNADPRSVQVDVCGLTSILLGCTISSTKHGRDLSSQLQEIAVNETVKRALSNCESSFAQATQLVQTSSEFFSDRDFSKAWHNLDGARMLGYDGCFSGFGFGRDDAVPPELLRELRRFRDLCQEGATIISDFAGGSRVPCID
ncbi:putative invertase inhibitor [Aristolochia californica]|uniref:putative invertase inhibitor n=1 Tax=Aristolochia californica TaxID=171875 RepID=UPI0035D8A9A2